MCAEYLGHAVFVKEPVDDVHSKHIPSAPRRESEACVARVGVRVRPHQVSKWPLVRYFLYSFNFFDIRYVLNCRGEPCVHAEHVVFNDCGYGQVVEQIGEELPDERGPILALALRVEPVDLRDLSSFMIASE